MMLTSDLRSPSRRRVGKKSRGCGVPSTEKVWLTDVTRPSASYTHTHTPYKHSDIVYINMYTNMWVCRYLPEGIFIMYQLYIRVYKMPQYNNTILYRVCSCACSQLQSSGTVMGTTGVW